MNVAFVHLPLFDKTVARLGVTDDELRVMQQLILAQPNAGNEIPGSGGVMKLRVPLRGQGKRSGARLIYFWLRRESLIYLMFLYPKSAQANLTQDQLRLVRQLVEDIKQE